jgi:hypothetical protein
MGPAPKFEHSDIFFSYTIHCFPQNGAREVSGAVDTVEGKTKKQNFD